MAAYLTRTVSSPLAWIEDEALREQIWDLAARRLAERSGRTGMGGFSRTFCIPLPAPAANGHAQTPASIEAAGEEHLLQLTLHEPALAADNLGLKTWASAYLLAKRLPSLSLPPLPAGSRVLELGAGTGLVGLAAAATLHAHVVFTDLPEIVPNLAHNVCANATTIAAHGGKADVGVLDWSRPDTLTLFNHPTSPSPSPSLDTKTTPCTPKTFPLILAADPLYSSLHPQLFAQTVSYHLAHAEDARVVVEMPLRSAYAAERAELRERMERLGLRVLAEGEEVGRDDWDEEVRCWWGVWGWK